MRADQFKQSVVDEICARSADGEGVQQIIASLGLPVGEVLLWLQKFHHQAIVEAKDLQGKRKNKNVELPV